MTKNISLRLILLLCLVVSVLLCTSCSADNYYGFTPFEHYENMVNQYANENVGAVDVVFLGDSITEWYPLSSFYQGFTYANRGIAGDQIRGVSDRLVQTVYPLSPKVVVLSIGVNDILRDNSVLGCQRQYDDLLENLKENLPDTTIIIGSILPVGENLARYQDRIVELNSSIKNLAKKHGCLFVDTHSRLLDQNTEMILPAYTTDGLHLSESGYQVVSQAFMPFIEGALRGR